MESIAQRTNGQIEAWVIKSYFDGTLENELKNYALYWINRLNLTKHSYIF